VVGIRYVNSLNSFPCQLISYMIRWGKFIVFIWFAVLVNFMIFGWFVGCSLVTWLNYSTLLKLICQLLSLNPSSPHYNSYKVLLIILYTLHFSGGEFESLREPLVVCIFGMSLGELMLYFERRSESVPHFPKVRFYQSIWL